MKKVESSEGEDYEEEDPMELKNIPS